MSTPEQRAREEIDRLLTAAGWLVQDVKAANLAAARGVALREFELNPGYGTADYLLYVDGRAAGVIEAKKQGATLTGVETQSGRYARGLPAALPAHRRPLPFVYESTGRETHFTNGLDPEPRARNVFAFHAPATLADWLGAPAPAHAATHAATHEANEPAAPLVPATFLHRVRQMPELVTEWGDFKLWPAQITAIRNLETSLAQNRPRALIQMATGSGKTFTAISLIYRLIKFAGARRVLFLVDRGNLGRQTAKEFDQYVSPVNNYKFSQEFIVQHLTSNQLDTTARVCISTIQRVFSKSDLFPQRQELPKTLAFAKDDNHADAIVGILREERGRGNEFAQKITYRTTGSKPEELIKAFRTSYYPRIAVTAHIIATGTDIRPVEIVAFMHSVNSRSFLKQMKGGGVRATRPRRAMRSNPQNRAH